MKGSNKAIKNKSSNENSCKNTNSKKYSYNPYRYAAIYARQSIQNDSYSIPTQIDDCKKKIQNENLILYKVYEEKASGNISYLERKAFTNLLSDLYSGMFKTVVVVRMDRLSRRIDDFLRIKSIFKKHDVRVIYVNESELNIFDKSYMSKFIQNIIMSVSTFEPDNISMKTSIGKKNKRERGEYSHGRTVPYGLIYDKTKKHYYVNKEEAENIRKIFEIYNENIDKVGTKDKNGKKFTKTYLVELIKSEVNIEGRKVIQSLIEGIVQRPIYAGYILLNSEIKLIDMLEEENGKYKLNEDNLIDCTNLEGAKENPIIDKEFRKKVVVKKLTKDIKDKKEVSKYLFKKLLYCGNCSKRIVKYINYDEYICVNKCIQLTEDEIMKLLIPKLVKDSNDEHIKKKIDDKIGTIKVEITNKKKCFNNTEIEIKKLVEKFILDPNCKELREEIIKLNKRKESYKKELSNLGDILGKLINRKKNLDIFKFQMSELDDEDKKNLADKWEELHELISNMVQKVVIKKSSQDEHSIETFYTEE